MFIPPKAHLTYCTNIHAGEDWPAVRDSLGHVLAVKEITSPLAPFGIGLRLSATAASQLAVPNALAAFKNWLATHDCYVFTLNGFPYGGFHHRVVKDAVHAPDWTTRERLSYTTGLFDLLAELLPDSVSAGGISTSPLSYRPWFATKEKTRRARQAATLNLMEVVLHLVRLRERTGKRLHLDLEPEPDGLLDNSEDLVRYFEEEILTEGLNWLHYHLRTTRAAAEAAIREHLAYCWDICHVAVAYERPKEVLTRMRAAGIRVGKLQISAALAAPLENDRGAVREALRPYDEPTYLHQAILRSKDGSLTRFPDLAPALAALHEPAYRELRTHFHVPIYAKSYGLLESTNETIEETLQLWKRQLFTDELEVETYTWDVLPHHQRLDLIGSIHRELAWVRQLLQT